MDASVGAGIEDEKEVSIGFGASVITDLLKYNLMAYLGGTSQHTVSVSRSTSTAYEYEFGFSSEISTSTDPNTAGHPSDIIIGGGVDLFVKESLEGTFPPLKINVI